MEASVWMRSKKPSGFGAANGLMFLFCLLTLICQTSSNKYNEELANQRQEYQLLKERLDGMKAQLIMLSRILEKTTMLDQAMEHLKNLADSFPDIFPETAAYQREIVQTIDSTMIRMKEWKDESQHKITEQLKEIEFVEEELNEATEMLDLIEKTHDEF